MDAFIQLSPSQSQQIKDLNRAEFASLLRNWAGEGKQLVVDSAGDRIQLRRNGEATFDSALTQVENWMRSMRVAGKTTFVINEWPNQLEVRNTFDTRMELGEYSVEPMAQGGGLIRGKNSVQIGEIRLTPDGWVAFRGSPLPDGNEVRTQAYSHPQLAFEEFLRIDGFLEL